MSERPWMPLYINDFRMDTLDLGADEIGVYLILLMMMWKREDAALPNDMHWLKRSLRQCAANFHGHTFNRIVPKLLKRYFQLGEDDKWRNKRLTKERQNADKRSANQSQIADKRWARVKENNGLADATAMPSHSQSHSHKERGGQLRVKKEEANRVFVEFDTPEWEERSKHPPPGKSRWPHRDFLFDDGVKHGWYFPKADVRFRG